MSIPRRPRTTSHLRADSIQRSQTDIPQIPFHVRETTNQWRYMAETYAWVLEQELVGVEKARPWSVDQRTSRRVKRRKDDTLLRENLIYAYELEAEQWMRQQEEERRRIADRERLRTKMIQDELRRVEERVRQRRADSERRRLEEERYQIMAESSRRRERRETLEGWKRYEQGWAGLTSCSQPLTFRDIPWPIISSPSDAQEILLADIKSFLLSPLHSQQQTRKDRIRSAQLRWHPDRFSKVLKRVADEDKAAVEEGAGIVARCLNELMAERCV